MRFTYPGVKGINKKTTWQAQEEFSGKALPEMKEKESFYPMIYD
jgi:hypothetical protein